jgi:curved DNA-binding protein CbpA
MDPYSVLGVSIDINFKDLRSHFIKLSRKWHPDKNRSPDAGRIFNELRQAYNAIKDIRQIANFPDYDLDYLIDEDHKIEQTVTESQFRQSLNNFEPYVPKDAYHPDFTDSREVDNKPVGSVSYSSIDIPIPKTKPKLRNVEYSKDINDELMFGNILQYGNTAKGWANPNNSVVVHGHAEYATFGKDSIVGYDITEAYNQDNLIMAADNGNYKNTMDVFSQAQADRAVDLYSDKEQHRAKEINYQRVQYDEVKLEQARKFNQIRY